MADTPPPSGGKPARTVATGYVTDGRRDGSGMFLEFVAVDGDDGQQEEGQAADDPEPADDPGPAGDAERVWDLGLLFTVASGGRLFYDIVMEDIHDLVALLSHLTRRRGLLTVHLPDAANVASEHVRKHLLCWPDVAAVLTGPDAMSREETLAWLDQQRERFGPGQRMPAMPVCDWQPRSALEMLADVFRAEQAASATARAQQARAQPELEPEWPMRAVLQVATLRMMPSTDDFAVLHELLCHLTDVSMIMVAPVTAAAAVQEHVRGELPWLADAEATMPPVDQDQTAWLAEVEREHGTHVRVAPSGRAYPHIGPSTSDPQTILKWVAEHGQD